MQNLTVSQPVMLNITYMKERMEIPLKKKVIDDTS